MYQNPPLDPSISTNAIESRRAQVEVRDISPQLLGSLVKVHQQAFGGYLNTRLGDEYLKKFFEWFLITENTIAIGAFDSEGKMLGYTIGAPAEREGSLSKHVLTAAMWGALTHFWLFLDPHFLKVVAARLGLIRTNLSQRPELPAPTIDLFGIGVLPSARGKKVGEALMSVFEMRACQLGVKAMNLSVYPENMAARKLYEKMGWLPQKNLQNISGAIYYHKLTALY